MIRAAGAAGHGARTIGRLTLGELLLLVDGWTAAHAAPGDPQADEPTDDEFEAALAASAARARRRADG